MNTKSKALAIAQAGIIAALYVALTFLANAFGLANYAIQIRFSEALTILPIFTPAAIPGLFIGCLLSNILTGCILLDVICGSLTTLIAAVFTYLIGRTAFKYKHFLAPLPPIIGNTIVVPLVLAFGNKLEGAIWYFALTVCAGEIISCGILGVLLYLALRKKAYKIFGTKQ
ncbi:MAG: QueT transporter family protein [Lachnospiraceae bacterium]|nr:QueT transporter family protein [Lachnospiraceae bacterium]